MLAPHSPAPSSPSSGGSSDEFAALIEAGLEDSWEESNEESAGKAAEDLENNDSENPECEVEQDDTQDVEDENEALNDENDAEEDEEHVGAGEDGTERRHTAANGVDLDTSFQNSGLKRKWAGATNFSNAASEERGRTGGSKLARKDEDVRWEEEDKIGDRKGEEKDRNGVGKDKSRIDKDENRPVGAPEGAEEAQMAASCPPHPGYMWGICIRCGDLKGNDEIANHGGQPGENNKTVALKYIHQGLELAGHEAARLRREELQRVLGARQLYLVLDLDHTLLNSARFGEVSPGEVAYMTQAHWGQAPPAPPENASPDTTLHQVPHLAMWTKLRPGIHQFLKKASEKFEMVVYTNGERAYAQAMAKILDPTGKLFGDRVISHGDSTRRGTKDLDVVLGADSAVLILDDSEHVWPKHRANLLLVERYHFFSSSRRSFGLKGAALVDQQFDESQSEGTLSCLLSALLRIHSEFFALKERGCAPASGLTEPWPDVRQVLRSVRLRLLSGCHLLFSRVFPMDLPAPYSHPLWRTAQEMGATCHLHKEREITHVVALDRGTEKARWGAARGCHLVHPGWLEASSYLWKRANEEDFPVRLEDGKGDRGPPVSQFAKAGAVGGTNLDRKGGAGFDEPGHGKGEVSAGMNLDGLKERTSGCIESGSQNGGAIGGMNLDTLKDGAIGEDESPWAGAVEGANLEAGRPDLTRCSESGLVEGHVVGG